VVDRLGFAVRRGPGKKKMKIQGAHIVISGGAGALGKAFAMDLASRGARVLASDLDQDGLVSLAKEGQKKGYAIETFQGDITQEQEVERLFQSAVDRFGRVDVVINNAGIAEDGLLVKKRDDRIEKFPLSRWQRGVSVNLTGSFLCAREGAYHMVRQGGGGVIINLSSISRHGSFVQSNYSATKAALVALTVVWAKELSRHGIRSVALAPGYLDTPLTRKIPLEVRNRIVPTIPQGRMGTIDEVIHAVRFVIENDYINGRVIDIDGGLRI
jgi:3-oxoacyl-[acyl-carrier protein] reductase